MRILVVDDEPAILRSLQRYFAKRGHEVHGAPSGAAALVLLDQLEPDLVISDFKMSAMNGLDLLALVGERFPKARRVLMSGYADVGRRPVDVDFLAKPCSSDELRRVCG
jgi:DNA-binding NtrC family response regulator